MDEPAAISPPAYITPSRAELLEWLQKKAAPLAALYSDALRIRFDEPPLQAKGRFISHAVREIRNRLPDFIAGPKGGGRLDYTGRLDSISQIWPVGSFSADAGSIPSALTVLIPTQAAIVVQQLITDHRLAREKPREAAVRLFEGCAPENEQSRASLTPQIQQWMAVTDWFVDRAHVPYVPLGTEEPQTWDGMDQKFDLFETTLIAMARGFFETSKEINEILEEANA